MLKVQDIKTGFIETQVGPLPSDWKLVPLGFLFDFKNGVNADKSAYGNGVKFINVMEIINNNVITDDKIPGTITLEEKQIKSNLVQFGDVLFNRTSETTNEIGLSAVYLDKGQTVFGGFVIRGRSKNNELFELFKKDCFQSSLVRKQIIARGQGAVRSNIGQGDLEKVLLPVPPLPEQKKISEILTEWDNAIDLTQNQISTLKIRNKGISQQLLSGKKRISGFNSKVNFIRLKGLIKEVSKRNKDLSVSNVLSVTNSRGFINQSEQFDRSVASVDLSNYKIVKKGQFAYNPSRVNVGSLDLLKNFEEGILSPMYVVFKTDPKQLLPEFLYYHLKSWWFTGHIPQYVQGSVRDSLSFDGLQSMSFFIPSIDEQIKIVEVLSEARQELEIKQKHLEELKTQRKGLMQKLLTGEVRVKI